MENSILIVNNNNIEFGKIEKILEDDGHFCYQCPLSSQHIFDFFQVEMADLILIDVSPDIKHYEIIKDIKKQNTFLNLPVIVILTHAQYTEVSTYKVECETRFLTKPYSENILLHTITASLHHFNQMIKEEQKPIQKIKSQKKATKTTPIKPVTPTQPIVSLSKNQKQVISEYIGMMQIDSETLNKTEHHFTQLSEKNKRSQYRTLVRGKKDIEINIMSANNKIIKGQLHNLSANGTGILIDVMEAAELALEEEVHIKFSFHRVKQFVETKAIVKFNLLRKNMRFCGFQLLDTSQFIGTLDPILFKWFNERSTFRVLTSKQTLVVIKFNNQLLKGTMNDISFSGIGFFLDKSVKINLDAQVIRLEFTLPTSPQNIVAMGRVKYRNVEENVIRYGIQFFE